MNVLCCILIAVLPWHEHVHIDLSQGFRACGHTKVTISWGVWTGILVLVPLRKAWPSMRRHIAPPWADHACPCFLLKQATGLLTFLTISHVVFSCAMSGTGGACL